MLQRVGRMDAHNFTRHYVSSAFDVSIMAKAFSPVVTVPGIVSTFPISAPVIASFV
jgi:hypothetical protein